MPATPLPHELRVMTQNLYMGTDLMALFDAAPADIPRQAGLAWQRVQRTDFAARAERLAQHIIAAAPHLVALQEAVQWSRQDMAGDGSPPQVEDFLAMLLAALRRCGGAYVEAASLITAEGAAPAALADGVSLVRLVDRNVVLARADLPAESFRIVAQQGARFGRTMRVEIAGQSFELGRGFVALDVECQGRACRFVNTHLEVFDQEIQAAQIAELLDGPGRVGARTILAGDFNCPAAAPPPSAYGRFMGAGYGDLWTALRSDPGFTCCQDEELANPVSALADRRDFILWRGRLRPLAAEIIGATVADRTDRGLWPSDHAGVIGSFALE